MPDAARIAGPLFFTVAFLLGLAIQAGSQTLPQNLPTKDDLAKDNNLFLTLARKALKWDELADPIRIVGRSISSARGA